MTPIPARHSLLLALSGPLEPLGYPEGPSGGPGA